MPRHSLGPSPTLLVLAIACLTVGIAFVAARPHRRIAAPNPGSAAEVAAAAAAAVAVAPAATDRPADVGNPAAESFLRKLDRSNGVPAAGKIRISDEDFSAAYDELYDHRDAYYGRNIELAGYVERQEDLPAGAFLVGRRLLWCCSEDAYFIGFLVLGVGTQPVEGSAIRVSGTIEAALYTNPDNGKSFTVPAIRAASIEAAVGIPRDVFPAAN